MRYYFPESPYHRWFRQKGDCHKVTQAAAVDISKDAPLSKQEQRAAAAEQRRVAQAAAPRPGDGLLRFMKQVDAVHSWWNAPPAQKPDALHKSASSSGAAQAASQVKPIDKFDLQDVADTLDRLGFTLAATLLRKWFTNRAYRAQWKGALDGAVPDYPADMVDTTTLKHSELVQHHYIKEAFDRITSPDFLRSKPVQDALLKVLRRIPQGVSGVIVSTQYGEDEMLALHRKYAFASVSVGRRFPGYYADIRMEDIFRSQNTTDDVELAIGEFRWFLALERVSIYPNRTTRLMQVKSVAVYAMASYGFETPEGGTAYRGHWNKKHVSLVTNGDWVDAPVYIGNDVYARNAVLWPITDTLFQQWRERHKKGGDMLLFTKPLHPWMQMLEFTVPLQAINPTFKIVGRIAGDVAGYIGVPFPDLHLTLMIYNIEQGMIGIDGQPTGLEAGFSNFKKIRTNFYYNAEPSKIVFTFDLYPSTEFDAEELANKFILAAQNFASYTEGYSVPESLTDDKMKRGEYNSGSYLAGLLHSVLGYVPKIDFSSKALQAPGWDMPMPDSCFKGEAVR